MKLREIDWHELMTNNKVGPVVWRRRCRFYFCTATWPSCAGRANHSVLPLMFISFFFVHCRRLTSEVLSPNYFAHNYSVVTQIYKHLIHSITCILQKNSKLQAIGLRSSPTLKCRQRIVNMLQSLQSKPGRATATTFAPVGELIVTVRGHNSPQNASIRILEFNNVLKT